MAIFNRLPLLNAKSMHVQFEVNRIIGSKVRALTSQVCGRRGRGGGRGITKPISSEKINFSPDNYKGFLGI